MVPDAPGLVLKPECFPRFLRLELLTWWTRSQGPCVHTSLPLFPLSPTAVVQPLTGTEWSREKAGEQLTPA